MMSRFADAAEYEDAKVELADRMLGDILTVPEMTDAQAIFDGFQRWQRQACGCCRGRGERGAGAEGPAEGAEGAEQGVQPEDV